MEKAKTKIVSILAKNPIKGLSCFEPFIGIKRNVEMSVEDIKTALKNGGVVTEVLANGTRITLNLQNYDKINEVKPTKVEEPVILLTDGGSSVKDIVYDTTTDTIIDNETVVETIEKETQEFSEEETVEDSDTEEGTEESSLNQIKSVGEHHKRKKRRH